MSELQTAALLSEFILSIYFLLILTHLKRGCSQNASFETATFSIFPNSNNKSNPKSYITICSYGTIHFIAMQHQYCIVNKSPDFMSMEIIPSTTGKETAF